MKFTQHLSKHLIMTLFLQKLCTCKQPKHWYNTYAYKIYAHECLHAWLQKHNLSFSVCFIRVYKFLAIPYYEPLNYVI